MYLSWFIVEKLCPTVQVLCVINSSVFVEFKHLTPLSTKPKRFENSRLASVFGDFADQNHVSSFRPWFIHLRLRHSIPKQQRWQTERTPSPQSNGYPQEPVNGTDFTQGFGQAHLWANLLPAQSPNTPTLRANPYLEVTDPICRLPSPTLFYRPEAIHLGDLLQIWVHADATLP